MDRLHIVMGVQEHGRLAGGAKPLAVGVGVRAVAAEDLSLLQSGAAHLLARQLGGLFDLLLVFAVGADAADGHQVGQVLDEVSVVLVQPIEVHLHGSSPTRKTDAVSLCAAAVQGREHPSTTASPQVRLTPGDITANNTKRRRSASPPVVLSLREKKSPLAERADYIRLSRPMREKESAWIGFTSASRSALGRTAPGGSSACRPRCSCRCGPAATSSSRSALRFSA